MKSTRKPHHGTAVGHPQPLTEPGVKYPQQFQEEEEEEAVRRWLAHVDAGRIG